MGEELAHDQETELEPMEVEVEAPQLTPREEKLAAIEAAHDAEASGVIVDEFGGEVPSTTSDEDYDNLDPELAPEPEPDSPVFKNDDGNYAVNLRVNGQDVSRTLDEMKADSQKHLSADMRLQELAAQQKNIASREAELKAQYDSFQAQIAEAQNNQLSSQDVGEDALEGAKAVMEQIYDGNTDDAAERLAKMIEGRQQPTQIDAKAIEDAATAKAIAQIESINADKAHSDSVAKGADWLNEAHPEILESEALTRYVDSEINQVVASNPSITPEAAIRLAADTVLTQMGKAPQEQQVSSRNQNKAALQREPVRQSGKRTRVEPVVEDNSPAATIARMREDRMAIRGQSYK